MGDDTARHLPDRIPSALVTRPHGEAASLAAALAERGVAAIVEPLLDIHYLDAPPPDLDAAQAILCTSANGVRALARLTDRRTLPLLAVGEATAEQARALGFARVESASGNVEDLVCLADKRLSPQAGRLLHVAGRVVAGNLAGALQHRGFQVDRAVLYEARPALGLSTATVRAFAAGEIDFALFFSPRTAMIFAELTAAASIGAAMRRVAAISISAAADAALGDLPFGQHLVAARPEQRGLLAVLDRALAERRCP